MLLVLALQAAAPAPAPNPAPPPQSFSILAPVPPAPCRQRLPDDEVVVCGRTADTQRLPLLAERGPPDRPMPSNPRADGMGALRATATPCATVQGGCQVGVDVFGAGTAAVRLVQKLISPDSCCEADGEGTSPAALIGDMAGGVKRLFAGKPDKSNRVAIPLNDPLPPPPRATP